MDYSIYLAITIFAAALLFLFIGFAEWSKRQRRPEVIIIPEISSPPFYCDGIKIPKTHETTFKMKDFDDEAIKWLTLYGVYDHPHIIVNRNRLRHIKPGDKIEITYKITQGDKNGYGTTKDDEI